MVFSIGGLLLDKDHFNVLDHYFPDPPIPYISTPQFHASAPPFIFDETYISLEQGTREGNLPLDHQDIYRIQEQNMEMLIALTLSSMKRAMNTFPIALELLCSRVINLHLHLIVHIG